MSKTIARTRAARRAVELPYAHAHERSRVRAWDSGARRPTALRDVIRQARRAYEVEVPGALTEGSRSVGDDGNPRFSMPASTYIFDGSRQERDGALGYEHYPFRFTLGQFRLGDPTQQLYAAIVWRVTAGGMPPAEAAIACGVQPDAIGKPIAELALRAVMGRVSDLVVIA